MPFFGVGTPPLLWSRRPHRTFTIPLSPSCRAISQVETRCLRSRCSVPFFRCWSPPQPLCSRRPHRTFTIPLSPLCRAIVQVETRSWCAHGSRCPLGVGLPPPLFSRRPHWTFVPLSPSCKAVSFKSRRARCLRSWFSMPFFGGVGRATVPQCSRRPHWTFVPLSPASCKAIVQVDTRSLCAHGSRCPLWRQATATAVILPLT